MKTTVTNYDFHRAFADMNRQNNFSPAALDGLFEYFEMLEEDMGEELELDVIAICCEYTEYESVEEFITTYSSEWPDTWEQCKAENEDEADALVEFLEKLAEYTQVVWHDDASFVIADF
ncbi:hypothetical protein LJC23_07310 [Desulfovibrio sp. OttesenSCG-928-I05]|nr:hypothetical protein [Desulfovibrio sp. OttesenSCG-928-I05]